MKADPNEHGALEEAISALKRADRSSKQKIEQIRHPADNQSMSEPLTRPELDAKLEAMEARLEGRVVRIEDAVKGLVEANRETRAAIGSLKTTTVITAISAVIAIVFGVAAFNATLLGNMTGAQGAGQDVGAALERSRAQMEATQQLLEQIRQERQTQQ